MKTVKAIINPKSAHGQTEKNWSKISARLEAAIGPFSFEFTQSKGHATEICRKFLTEGGKWVISIGGDGTLNETINGFFNDKKNIFPDRVFSVVSTGTGSDFAKSVRDLFEVPDLLDKQDKKFTDHNIDAVRVTCGPESRYFANIASYGLGAIAVDHINRWQFLKVLGGKAGYYLITVFTLLMQKNNLTEIRLNEKSLQVKIQNIAIANGIYQGGGMKMAPKALLDDGLLDVILFEDLGFWETLFLSKKIYAGEHIRHKKIRCFKSKKVEIKSPKKIPIELDGESFGFAPAVFEVLPSAIKIRV